VTALTVLIERFQDIGLWRRSYTEKWDHPWAGEYSFLDKFKYLYFFHNSGCPVCKSCCLVLQWSTFIWITIAFSSNFVLLRIVYPTSGAHQASDALQATSFNKNISATLSLAVGNYIGLEGYGYWALVLEELARSFLSTVLAWSFCPLAARLACSQCRGKVHCSNSGAVLPAIICFFISPTNLDSILLGKFYGAVPVGLYSRARQLTAVPLTQLLEPMKNVSLPALSALQDDPAKYSKLLRENAAFSHLYICL